MIAIDSLEIEQLMQLCGIGFILGVGGAAFAFIVSLLINTFFDIAK